MMGAKRRSLILSTVLVAVLLLTLPGAIRGIVQTGDSYLFTRDFFTDTLARLSGPGKVRFILQQAVASFLGTRDGVKNSQAESPPLLVEFHISQATCHRAIAERSSIHAEPCGSRNTSGHHSSVDDFLRRPSWCSIVGWACADGSTVRVGRSSANRIARWRSGQVPVKRASRVA
jgi:hypothetical protein